MPALVLCDGGHSALRAIEVAGCPGGLFMGQHDGAQLVIVHAWQTPSSTSSPSPVVEAAPAGKASGNAQVAQAHSRDSTAGPTAGAPEDAAALEAAPGPLVEAAIPVAQVCQSVVGVVKDSKILRDTLLYKLETAALPFHVSSDDGEETDGLANGSDTAPAGKRGDSPGKQGSPAARSAKKKEPVAAAGGPVHSTPSSPAKTLEELSEVRLRKQEAVQACWASTVVDYSTSRAAHHGCETILLGTGNTQEGKSVVVGHTARAALAAWKAEYALCFVKADGFVPRRVCAGTRLLVVVPLDGGEETEADERLISTQVPGVPSHVDGGEALPSPPHVALEAGRAVVRFALGAVADMNRAMTSVSSSSVPAHAPEAVSPVACEVAVLIAATPLVSAAVISQFQCAFETLLGRSSGSGDERVCAATAVNVEDGESDGASEPWKPVTVLTLKSSKQVRDPSFENSAAQVARGVQQTRAEYVLVADNAPAALHEALLSANKPHCLVIPHVKY